VSNRELDAAGITGPALRRSYLACRALNASHGRTYYLSTLLLPAAKRPHVHALYGFARYADEIVDDLDSTLSVTEKADWLGRWSAQFLSGQSDGGEYGDLDVLPALRDTITRFDIPLEHFEAFLASMRMDLTIGEYETFDDLLHYVHGSAAVIGLQMLPVLGHPGIPHDVVAPYAMDLGVGFQLANFIRDVAEDLRRGRLYLPLEDLERFGVTREQLSRGVVDARVRALVAFEVERARALLDRAAHGIRLVDPRSRDCLHTAATLYGGILDEVERAGYDVLSRRVAVGRARRLAVAGPGLVRARRARSLHPPRVVSSVGRPGDHSC
jgi:phytoene synthase